jgi:hypothetical protein
LQGGLRVNKSTSPNPIDLFIEYAEDKDFIAEFQTDCIVVHSFSEIEHVGDGEEVTRDVTMLALVYVRVTSVIAGASRRGYPSQRVVFGIEVLL